MICLADPFFEIASISKLKDLHNLRQKNFADPQKKMKRILHQGKDIKMKGVFGLIFRKIIEIDSVILLV
jgi:hypothetical protein